MAEAETKTKKENKEKTAKSKKVKFISGLGRRKRAVARVWLYPQKGEITINDQPAEEYFPGVNDITVWAKPFHTVGVSHPAAKFSATIKVAGGGKTGQLGAVRLGLARALLSFNPEFREKLREQDLLTRDSRETERKKYYLRKARKRPQYSKR